MKRLLLLLLFCFVSFVVLGRADAAPQYQTGFVALPNVWNGAWVQISPSGSRAAVVQRVAAPDSLPVGKQLDIYSLRSDGSVEKRLFQEVTKKAFINEFQWVGPNLVFSTLQGFDSVESWGEALVPLSVEDRFALARKALVMKVWAPDVGVRDLASLSINLAGGIFPATPKVPYSLINSPWRDWRLVITKQTKGRVWLLQFLKAKSRAHLNFIQAILKQGGGATGTP